MSVLWGNHSLPIVGLAGEPNTGKTLWGLTVDPNCLDPTAKKTTLTWDAEDSSKSYEKLLNFTRVDLPKLARKRKQEYRALDMFEVWWDSVRQMKDNSFRVCMLDTVSEIEAGLVTWIGQRPGDYGYTSSQFEKGEGLGGGLFWGTVKSEWKRMLLIAAQKCETLVLTMHMKNEFRGPIPTGRKIPMGKETIMDITSLYMTLTRNAAAGSSKCILRPSGLCQYPFGKSRLMGISNVTGLPVQLLPPRIPDASPDGIKVYLDSPPDLNNLLPGERLEKSPDMSDEDKLIMQASIAEIEKEKAQVDLVRVELERKVQKETKRKMTKPRSTMDELKDAVLSAMTIGEAKIMLQTRYAVSKLSELNSIQATDLASHLKSLGN